MALREFDPTRQVLAIALLATMAFVTACGPSPGRDTSNTLTVSVQRASTWVRNFNPFAVDETPRWPTIAGIHEPLMVFNSVLSGYVPWLANSYEWSEDNTVLRFTLRKDVRWSDGRRFDAEDVAFTFDLLHQHPAADERLVWNYLRSVRAVDTRTVEFVFDRVHVPGFDDIVIQPIVPEHIWNSVDDPLSFDNADPVGTGPFTEVRLFESDVYELGRNPHYWQKGVPAVEVLRFPALADNDASTQAMMNDVVDWSGHFIPSIETVFVEPDPAHHHYWFPLTGGGIFLYANTTRPPFDDVAVRRSLSLAIDRDALVVDAMAGYTRPANATGLTDTYASWIDSSAIRQGSWVNFDVERARALLQRSSWGADAERTSEQPFELLCVDGWSDWRRAADLISENLRAIGVAVDVHAVDFETWSHRVGIGDFDLTLGWSLDGVSPYQFYLGLMGSATCLPLGQVASTNWHRYRSARADKIFAQFEAVSDSAERHRLGVELQRVFVDEAPAIPLFPGPSWAAYNTARVRGFPSPSNPYADPSPNKYLRGEVLLVLTRLQPSGPPGGR